MLWEVVARRSVPCLFKGPTTDGPRLNMPAKNMIMFSTLTSRRASLLSSYPTTFPTTHTMLLRSFSRITSSQLATWIKSQISSPQTRKALRWARHRTRVLRLPVLILGVPSPDTDQAATQILLHQFQLYRKFSLRKPTSPFLQQPLIVSDYSS